MESAGVVVEVSDEVQYLTASKGEGHSQDALSIFMRQSLTANDDSDGIGLQHGEQMTFPVQLPIGVSNCVTTKNGIGIDYCRIVEIGAILLSVPFHISGKSFFAASHLTPSLCR